ncbi:Tm-1-like ATP-binding domain-containing protein [Thermodesulfobacteriota bacterium]
MTIAVVGMIDEREEALRLIKERIEQHGHKVLLIDISIGTGAITPSLSADIDYGELSELGGGPSEGVAGYLPDRREEAISIMTRGLKEKIMELYKNSDLKGMLAITGLTGAMISLPAMKELPFGLPKIIISSAMALPVHADKYAEFVCVKDITVMHAVVDTVGMNSLVRKLALNGADSISGMTAGAESEAIEERPSIAITEFGFTDQGAHFIREFLEEEYELVSFHANGVGDLAAMEIIPQGPFKAFIDLVPGAFSEYLLGGNRNNSGPNRLDITSELSIPYILCPGGFDIISCGPVERKDSGDHLWKSRKLAERKLYIQEHPRAHARMNAEELEHVAFSVAERLNLYMNKERVKVVIPLSGFSSLSVENGPLYDPEVDKMFASTIKNHLDPEIEIIEVDSDINSKKFAAAVVKTLKKIMG